MDLANASLLDEGTAAAEAMTMLHRLNPNAGDGFFVDADCHPQTIEVVRTRAEPLGIAVTVGDPDHDVPDEGVFGMLLQYPGSSGEIRDHRALVERAHAQQTLVAFAVDLLALTLRTPPREFGGDGAVGTPQRFGACRSIRRSPRRAPRDAMNTSARCRAGSSACRSTVPAVAPYRLACRRGTAHPPREGDPVQHLYGPGVARSDRRALRAVSRSRRAPSDRRVHRLTATLAARLRAAGVEVVTANFFDTITVRTPGRAAEVAAAARSRRINLREVDADTLVIALDETTTTDTVAAVCAAFGVAVAGDDAEATDAIPVRLRRTSEYLTHPAFHQYRSEHQMLRYLRRLADRDLALDRTMIPLGSCTMKLNATAEMVPITWPEFGRIHPFEPVDQEQGYLQLFEDLGSGSPTSPATARSRCGRARIARRVRRRSRSASSMRHAARPSGMCPIPRRHTAPTPRARRWPACAWSS